MSHIESFEITIPQLSRTRKVWVFLPQNYGESGKSFPVIYMHDGQNLFFDELTAYGTAWHVDATMERIFAQTGFGAIVVGAECLPERRLSEYSPWRVARVYGAKNLGAQKPNNGGEGEAYAEFFANDLKNYIDSHYNTDPSRLATAVAGSSMGGLISCYLGLKYQQIYGTMGLFSTFTPFNTRAFENFLRSTSQALPQQAFVYCGGKEGLQAVSDDKMVAASERLYSRLAARGIDCELVIDSEMPHFETAWDKHFEKFALNFLKLYAASGK